MGLILLHLGLLAVAFIIMLNGFLHGSLKAKVDVVFGLLWVVLLIAAFWLFGLKSGLFSVALSFLYAVFTRPLARVAANWLLEHPPG